MWDKRYEQENFVYGKEPNDFLKEHYQTIPRGGKVLCLAEGEGRNGVFLARQGYDVTAVDLSSVGLDKALKLAHENEVDIETVVADLAHYELGVNKWDGIVSIWAHLPSTVREQLHQKVEDALKPQGIFLLEAYTVEHLDMVGKGGPPATRKDSFMSRAQLSRELPNLEQLLAREMHREIAEGEMHQGLSAVVQLIARKP